ncbi:MAG: hypothetical protein JJE36_06325 [Coriobacteriia bacterium]|nr:hypothetical protein [Coriobacteriia bacterium]
MKTAILYSTHFGYTGEAALALKEALKKPAKVIPFDNLNPPKIEEYDTIVLGSSIRMGLINPDFRSWLEKNKLELASKRIALFLACGFPKDFNTYIQNNFPREIIESSISTVAIGGKLDGKMKWFDRLLVKLMKKQVEKSGGSPIVPTLSNFDDLVAALENTEQKSPSIGAEPSV